MSADFEQRLRAARNALPAPDASYSSSVEERVAGSVGNRSDESRRHAALPTRTLVAAAAVAVVVGVLGFGIGHWVVEPPSGSAATAAEYAPGFSPAKGWNTVSTGIPAPPQAPTAIASNVPFAPQAGGLGNFPSKTINGLGKNGIVIVVTLYPHESSSSFPPRMLPLQLSDATLSQGFEGISPRIANDRLLANVGNWDIDAMAFFGTAYPNDAQIATAQAELDRLVIPNA